MGKARKLRQGLKIPVRPGQEGVNFSRAGLALGGKWYWEEDVRWDPLFLSLSFLKFWEHCLLERGRGQGGVGRGGLGSVGSGGALSSAPHAPGEAHGTSFLRPCLPGTGRGQPAANPRGHCHRGRPSAHSSLPALCFLDPVLS